MSPMKKVLGLVLHCSGTVVGDAASFRSYHKNTLGWSDIGYHGVGLNGRRGSGAYVPELDGKIEPGRAEKYQGSHCKAGGMNRCTLGYCNVGYPGKGVPKGAKPAPEGTVLKGYLTARQWESTVHWCAVNCIQYDIDPLGSFVHPVTGKKTATITQHSMFEPLKPLCASLNIPELRRQVADRVKAIKATMSPMP